MTDKEALEKGKKRNGFPLNETFYVFTDKELNVIEKDLNKLEHIKILVEKYNNDELHFTRGFDFINIVKEVLNNDK